MHPLNIFSRIATYEALERADDPRTSKLLSTRNSCDGWRSAIVVARTGRQESGGTPAVSGVVGVTAWYTLGVPAVLA